MLVSRIVALLLVVAGLAAAQPAAAQFYFKPPELAGTPVTGAEPGIVGQALTDATPAELRAALVWNLRAALNVAALQCQFAPTLLTLDNYNAILRDHKHELKTSYDTLTGYFRRKAKTPKEGQNALDQYGTRVYSGFSTVSAQLTFCLASGRIGHDALFVPRGKLGDVAQARMRELRNSLVPRAEQQFPATYLAVSAPPRKLHTAMIHDQCWSPAGWLPQTCGAFPGEPLPVTGKKKKKR
jgi:hypothetical protein